MTNFRALHRAAIISTGTEILQGLYADTNARYLAEQLSGLGMDVVLTAAAPDEAEELETLLRHAAARADLIICSGGLGPTEDDVNRDVFAKVFGVELVRDEKAVAMMRQRFESRGRTMPERNEVQALIPKGAQTFYNEWGTAPGFFLPPEAPRLAPGHCALMALPGPPKELAPMFEKDGLTVLGERAGGGKLFVRTRTVHTFGVAESELGTLTRDLFRRDPAVKYTILAKTYGVDFRITARATTREEMNARIAAFEAETRSRVGEKCIYGADTTTMPEAVAALLLEKKATVAAAESCTGGLVSKMLTDISGSSAYLRESYVVYANEAKERILGVKAETLATHGAVSEETAREMADGVRRVSGADFGISVTGIAGPTGGTDDKPVGLTFVGLSSAHKTIAMRHVFLADREQNRNLAALTALNLLRRELLGG
ncbi:MAG: competence/damage-inducible protein A [Candidatus Sumerlaeaceae bacterium]|nr:competence/damage-inducible protein A [Candidatus Sumerlaeaceae bacterium]